MFPSIFTSLVIVNCESLDAHLFPCRFSCEFVLCDCDSDNIYVRCIEVNVDGRDKPLGYEDGLYYLHILSRFNITRETRTQNNQAIQLFIKKEYISS